jgi:hypothetical protein
MSSFDEIQEREECEERLRELFEERAAIIEFEGGLSREEAEEEAKRDVYGGDD